MGGDAFKTSEHRPCVLNAFEYMLNSDTLWDSLLHACFEMPFDFYLINSCLCFIAFS